MSTTVTVKTVSELIAQQYEIKPKETVVLSDLNIRICSLAMNTLPIWVKKGEDSSCDLWVDGLENKDYYPLNKKDCALEIHDGMYLLGIVGIKEAGQTWTERHSH